MNRYDYGFVAFAVAATVITLGAFGVYEGGGEDAAPAITAEPPPYAAMARAWATTLRLEPEAVYCTSAGDCTLLDADGNLHALVCVATRGCRLVGGCQ